MQMTEIQSLLAGDASRPPCISAKSPCISKICRDINHVNDRPGVLLADPLRIAAFALSAIVSA